MLVVIPYHKSDAQLAKGLLDWMGELDGKLVGHTLYLLAGYEVDRGTIELVSGSAVRVFGKVITEKRAAPEPAGWPFAPNTMFQTVAKAVEVRFREHFLWLEPDATPLRPGWLDAIEREYISAGKPYMGTVYDWVSPVRRLRHLNGNAVYPANILRYNSLSLRATNMPFDAVAPEHTLRHAHISPLFQHTPGDFIQGNLNPQPWTFPNLESLSRLRSSAVLFHACKDGSLIRQLRQARRVSARGAGIRPCNTCVICLGRYGDIMGALPIAREIAEKKRHPVHFMVADQFADVLDGVTYVRPDVYGGKYNEMPKATEIAAAKYKKVVRAQIFSTPEQCPECGYAHNRKAWELAGYGKRFDDPSMVLEFDNRDMRRERELLIKTVAKEPKPVLAICLAGGNSGPFKDWKELQTRILSDLGHKYQICDLAGIRAHRVYDLLGHMEIASALVTIDTATVHLAGDCIRLPVAALLPDHPYYSSEPRSNVELTIRYGKWRENYDTLKNWLETKAAPPKIVHAYEQHSPLNDRSIRAQTTWPVLYKGFGWIPRPFNEPYKRDSRKVGDKCGVPFINDVLENAVQGLSDMDIVVFTNGDITLLPGIHNDILSHLARVPALACSRRDFQQFTEVTKQPPIDKHIHCGRDLFAFRAWWLRKYLPEAPLVYLGRNDWDNVFINLIRRTTGTLITGDWRENSASTITDSDMASGCCLHEYHVSYADQNHVDPSNEWNRVKLYEWAKEHCPEVNFWWTDKAVKRVALGITKFTPFKQKNGRSIIGTIKQAVGL